MEIIHCHFLRGITMLDNWRIAADLTELLNGTQHNLDQLARHLEDHPDPVADALLVHGRARLTAARAYLLFLDSDEPSDPCDPASSPYATSGSVDGGGAAAVGP
jgi:hypothetical protein